jgi:ABC-type bacteriocin/lantibiotic exporter with double-glycine peptidase domain
MVMRFWGTTASQGEIASALAKPELRGIAGSALAAYARERGFEAVAHKGDAPHLRRHLDKGRPLIVAWDMGDGRFHDVVVVGWDDATREAIVHDPARGAGRRMSARAFEERWKGAGHWTLLVVPRP